jgi:flagellar basal-body rod protein FlgG
MKLQASIHPYARLGNMEALEGAIILERKLQVASSNMANLETKGFKAQGITFEEYLLKEQDGTNRTAKGEVTWADFSQAPVRFSGNPYDFAIDGEGFFVIQTPNGQMYTRDGSFRLDSEYRLVTRQGYPVLGDGAPITLEDTTGTGVWLSEDGNFFVDETMTARLDVVTFDNQAGLRRVGGNFFKATGSSGPAVPAETPVKQGYTEDSNVNSMREMVHLIDLYRGYEMQQKALQAGDQLDSKAANELGKTST